MGEFIVYLIPTDPVWQPARDAADRVAARAADLAGIDRSIWPSLEVDYFSRMTVAHPMENLERIGCPRCSGEISCDWFDRQVDMDSPNRYGFDDLVVPVPCCGARVSLADLDYDWPAGFSRFMITLWNPECDLTGDHLAELSTMLGHDLRQIHAHP